MAQHPVLWAGPLRRGSLMIKRQEGKLPAEASVMGEKGLLGLWICGHGREGARLAWVEYGFHCLTLVLPGRHLFQVSELSSVAERKISQGPCCGAQRWW